MTLSALLSIVLVLCIVGLVLYAVASIPMPRWIVVVINALVAIFVILWIASMFGISTGLHLR
jgi:hypothetical protein